MKIILCGASGLVGGEVLSQCITNEAITSIFALTRRPLAKDLLDNPKITNILHEDFSHYPTSLAEQLAGAEACIWYASCLSRLSSFSTARRLPIVRVHCLIHTLGPLVA